MTPPHSDLYCGFVIAVVENRQVMCGTRPASYLDSEDGTALCDRHAPIAQDNGRRIGRKEGAA